MVSKATPAQTRRSVTLVWNQGQSSILQEFHLQIPPIERYYLSRPFLYASEWEVERNQLKILPAMWKPLAIYLNQHGLGNLELIREQQRTILSKKESLSEYERKWLRQVTQRNGVRRLFLYQYGEGFDHEYKRLNPINDTTQKTSILNLRSELRNAVLEVLNREYMPTGLQIIPWDLVSCHASIYAGLGGERMAPITRKALKSGRMRDFALEQTKQTEGEQKVQKKHLKTIFYKALNGGSLQEPKNIIDSIQEKHSLSSDDARVIAHEIFQLPIIRELRDFQLDLGGRE